MRGEIILELLAKKICEIILKFKEVAHNILGYNFSDVLGLKRIGKFVWVGGLIFQGAKNIPAYRHVGHTVKGCPSASTKPAQLSSALK